ncbi:hypothetical protein [Streptomyces sp. NRRL S-37]|uniref:hypothetical protein n=1 Tax=Streptomyces sp. NRRL S-37 TaxID=1463903 RepID=UPI0004C7A71B|nr:hypothetical protein [Streptomyces sp. NRRL S-37]
MSTTPRSAAFDVKNPFAQGRFEDGAAPAAADTCVRSVERSRSRKPDTGAAVREIHADVLALQGAENADGRVGPATCAGCDRTGYVEQATGDEVPSDRAGGVVRAHRITSFPRSHAFVRCVP